MTKKGKIAGSSERREGIHLFLFKSVLCMALLFLVMKTYGQESPRIETIKNNLEALAVDNPGLNESLKLEINVANITLPNFLIAISKMHSLNLNVAQDISNITIVNNFSDVTIADLLIFLCKEYDLDIEFTGNILSVKRYVAPVAKIIEPEIQLYFNTASNLISFDLKGDPVEKVFRKIIDATGENLLFATGMESIPLNLYLNDVPFDVAMEKLASMNGLSYAKSRDGFYLFNTFDNTGGQGGKARRQFGNDGIYYQVLDTLNKILDVDFNNAPIVTVIEELSKDLKLDVYTATPLEKAGNVSFNAKGIFYDDLLELIFENQQIGFNRELDPGALKGNENLPRNRTANKPQELTHPVHFTFKKENNIYFFGTADQLSVRQVEIVQMMHRSVQLLSDPQSIERSRSAGRTSAGNVNYFGTNLQSGNQINGQNRNTNRRPIDTQSSGFESYQNAADALVNILPDEIKSNLDIKIDFELNSFLVSGPSASINRFKKFIKEIDKPVPVILIEVMIIEVKKSSTIETGISWGIGEDPVTTQGKLFPDADVTLGANTINKIIGGFDGFGSFNVGQVVPGLFATIKAMEENGNLKIRSTPKLSTLNGHRANLSIGETTYYVITNQNFFGSQNPIPSEVRNYAPIDAELAISIKPIVSGNGQVTLEINVIQSDFSGKRIEDDAPPGITSREFSSIIRMQNQDLAILGGLEEKIKDDSGKGLPLLARIPVIKWFFSSRRREDTKQKLTLLIKPTVIY